MINVSKVNSYPASADDSSDKNLVFSFFSTSSGTINIVSNDVPKTAVYASFNIGI